ncbi:winged helix-turn-helix transcriptional regulator [Novosphingopyxis sp.]|uniref:winged helix-turn-helix transcriptional regulator n=1 Tax=Novosphingopyxis sp. TaxID=2709690 RepID=UPI003B596E1C
MENIDQPFRNIECDVFLVDCPARKVLGILAEKWALLIIHALSEETQRTGALRRRVSGISEKMLTQTLRRLEEHGIVARKSYREVPPRVEYSLTKLGWTLSPVIVELDKWVEEHALKMTG